MKKFAIAGLIFSLPFFTLSLFAQVGISVNPSKVYYRIPPGGSGSQNISISNPNDREIEVGIFTGDWDYDEYGNNRMHDAGTLKSSCSSWYQILPGSYFKLGPHETRDITVVLKVPSVADTLIPVHTSMLYVTQLNPGATRTKEGASIVVTVRMGIKIYHSYEQTNERDIKVTGFSDIRGTPDTGGSLKLELDNTGKIWLEGKIKWELLDMSTGKSEQLEDNDFYCLPGDHRIIIHVLPKGLKKGRYLATAQISYGDKDELKIVELEFEH